MVGGRATPTALNKALFHPPEFLVFKGYLFGRQVGIGLQHPLVVETEFGI
jgi:hypothetical protein